MQEETPKKKRKPIVRYYNLRLFPADFKSLSVITKTKKYPSKATTVREALKMYFEANAELLKPKGSV